MVPSQIFSILNLSNPLTHLLPEPNKLKLKGSFGVEGLFGDCCCGGGVSAFCCGCCLGPCLLAPRKYFSKPRGGFWQNCLHCCSSMVPLGKSRYASWLPTYFREDKEYAYIFFAINSSSQNLMN